MGRKNKYSKETKIKVINEYITGIKSLSDISKNIECSDLLISKTIYVL